MDGNRGEEAGMDPETCDAVSASPMGSSRARLPADGGHVGQDQPGLGPPAGGWSCWGTHATLAQVASEGANIWRRPAHCCPHLRQHGRGEGGPKRSTSTVPCLLIPRSEYFTK